MNSFIVTRRFKVTPHADGKHCGGCDLWTMEPLGEYEDVVNCVPFDEWLEEDGTDDEGRPIPLRSQACLGHKEKNRERLDRIAEAEGLLRHFIDSWHDEGPTREECATAEQALRVLHVEALGGSEE